MTKSPYVHLYTSDFLAGMQGLTASERGVFFTVVCMIYEREAPIDMPEGRLARVCGCTTKSLRAALDTLLGEGKLVEKDGGLWNMRAGLELRKRSEIRSSAKASAEARWLKTKQKQGKTDATALNPQCETDANHIPDTIYQRDTNVSLTPLPPKGADIRAILCEVLSESVADDFIDHRKAKRAKLTARAAKMIADDLRLHPSPDDVVKLSIKNGWTGVFPANVKGRLFDLTKETDDEPS